MCLITKEIEPKVAEKDIICYKNIEWNSYYEIWQTPYAYFELQDDIVNGKKPLVAEGHKTHGKVSNNMARMCMRTEAKLEDDVDYYKVEGGWIHVFKTKKVANAIASMFDDTIFKAIIPKGTKYYTDASGTEMCAEKIMFIKKA